MRTRGKAPWGPRGGRARVVRKRRRPRTATPDVCWKTNRVPSAMSPSSWKLLPALLLLAAPAAADCRGPDRDPPAGRPRIGLVLCGGGRRGPAHIGLLEGLAPQGADVRAGAGAHLERAH